MLDGINDVKLEMFPTDSHVLNNMLLQQFRPIIIDLLSAAIFDLLFLLNKKNYVGHSGHVFKCKSFRENNTKRPSLPTTTVRIA